MPIIRLQKFISDCGLMSRRKAEEEILLSHITINDIPATLGTKVDTDKDIVKYNGQLVEYQNDSQKHVYIMLNKPIGYVSTTSDEKGRKNVVDLVKSLNTRLYPIGRLDMYSEGLLLLTNDGELTNKLTHPSKEIPKVYKVKVKGSIDDESFTILTSPMEIDGYKLRPVKATIIAKGDVSKDGQITSTLKMTLFEGRNRQIRKMCQKANLEVVSLKRIKIGKLELGTLKPGEWRYLTQSEIEYLKG